MQHIKGWQATLAGSIFLAGLSTLGDWIWEMWLSHEVIWGILHGMVLCMGIGAVLAYSAGRAWKMGLLLEPVVGAIAAAAFYLIVKGMGWSAMFVAWMLMWLLTSLLYGYMLAQRPSLTVIGVRGLIAALASGLAFWAISDIWLSPAPGGPNYLWHLCAWTLAFLPGLGALFLKKDVP